MSETPSLTDPKHWENAEFEWGMKTYYSVSLKVFFGKINNLFEAVQQLRAEIATKDYTVPAESMLLIEITSLFAGRLLLEIQRPQQYDASTVEIEKSKVYTAMHVGPFKTITQTAKALKATVAGRKGVSPTAVYYWDFRKGKELNGQRADRFVVFARI